MLKQIADVTAAVDFLDKITAHKDDAVKLESASTHEEVIKFAADRGVQLNRETLAQAMKIVVDRALAERGIPSWVRARVHAPVHD